MTSICFQECDFLKKALAIPWILSTSQQPQQQIATSPSCDDPQYKNQVGPQPSHDAPLSPW